MENETRIGFMFQKRSLTTGFLVASLGIAAGLAVVSSPTVASADGCGDLKVAAVKAVCEKGGKDAVKKSMKAAMDAANKDGGDKLDCKSCHADQKEYKISDAKKAEDGFTKRMAAHFK
jgi:hypothetical protein